MFGELIGAAAGLAGKKPKVPDLPNISVQDEQGKAIAANIANLPNAEQLASSVNKFNSDEILKMLRAAIPGYDNITNKASGVIQSQLAGEVPQDVQNFLQSKAAARAVGGGYGGTGLHGNLGLRDLGLTSLQQTQQGLSSAENWLQTMRATSVAPQFNVSSMFIDPATQLNFALNDRAARFNRDWMNNQIKAMPDPTQQAAMGVLKNFDNLTWSAAGAFTGGMMGGMGGGMGAGLTSHAMPKGEAYSGPGEAPQGWGSLSAGQQIYYNNYVRDAETYGRGMNFE